MPTTSIAGDCTRAVMAHPRLGFPKDDVNRDRENLYMQVLESSGLVEEIQSAQDSCLVLIFQRCKAP